MAQNVNVDDLDLTYSAGWKASADCNGCSAAPNADQMRFVNKGTWHDAARQTDGDPVSMTYTFEGTGVTVYGITVNGTSARPLIKNVDLVFALDDDANAGAFTYTPDPSTTDYHFNVPFFTKKGLTNGRHTLKMELQPHSFVLLDYLVYTKEAVVKPDPPADPDTGNTGGTDPADGNTGKDNDTDNDPPANGNDNKDDDANNGGPNTTGGSSDSFAGGTSHDSSPQSTGAGAQLPGPSSTSGGGGLSTQTAITLAVLIPIVVAVIVIAVFFWWLRRRSAKRQAEVLAAAQIPPPPEFYGGPGGASTIASYHHPGSPAGMQFNPYAPGPLHPGSTYANPSYPFAPSSHVPSSVTDEDMDIAPAPGGNAPSASAYSGIIAAAPPPVMREKRGMPPNIQPQQYGPVPPLYSP